MSVSWTTVLPILIGGYALAVAVFLILENRTPQSMFAAPTAPLRAIVNPSAYPRGGSMSPAPASAGDAVSAGSHILNIVLPSSGNSSSHDATMAKGSRHCRDGKANQCR
jgi:hypothetical protein